MSPSFLIVNLSNVVNCAQVGLQFVKWGGNNKEAEYWIVRTEGWMQEAGVGKEVVEIQKRIER